MNLTWYEVFNLIFLYLFKCQHVQELNTNNYELLHIISWRKKLRIIWIKKPNTTLISSVCFTSESRKILPLVFFTPIFRLIVSPHARYPYLFAEVRESRRARRSAGWRANEIHNSLNSGEEKRSALRAPEGWIVASWESSATKVAKVLLVGELLRLEFLQTRGRRT